VPDPISNLQTESSQNMSRRIVPSVILAALSLACTVRPRLMDDCPHRADARLVAPVPVALALNTVAGGDPFAQGSTHRSQSGVQYKVSKFRYYLSEATLIDISEIAIEAPLADADGKRLPYGVALVDSANPESHKLSVLAPPGNYKALNLTLGVPNTCPGGEQLNHGDASARVAPLDVDSDMYWTWNPNYTFLKIEGQASAGTDWKPFFFHVGEDARRAKLHLHVPIVVVPGQPAQVSLVIDVNRLSRTREVSCASGHLQENAFAEPRAVSVGVQGRTGARNAPVLVNLAWNTSFFWESLTDESFVKDARFAR
jgi:hypothetical protein